MKNENNKGNLITGLKAKFYIAPSFLWIGIVLREAMRSIILKQNDRFLDIGCGPGMFLKHLRERFGNKVFLYGIDGSHDMVARAKKNFPDGVVDVREAFAQELPFENDFFDAVGSTLSFHHIPPEGKRKAIQEAYRVLKHGGRFILSDLGRPNGRFGRFLAWCSGFHAYTNGNMEIIESEICALGSRIQSKTYTFGWIETIVAIKP